MEVEKAVLVESDPEFQVMFPKEAPVRVEV
jgi:hypothetical protein